MSNIGAPCIGLYRTGYAVIGIPDEKWGEALLALVVLNDGHNVSEEELMEYSSKELAKYKIPRRWVFVNELPRNATGKVKKKELRAEYSEKLPSGAQA